MHPTTKNLSASSNLLLSGHRPLPCAVLQETRCRDLCCGRYQERENLTHFRIRAGTKSAFRLLKTPFPDITVFDAVVRSIVRKNALDCTSYRSARKNHPPVEVVREMHTAKFVYMDAKGKQIGSGSEVYDSVEGYQSGIAAVISNMANIASHRGKVRHIPDKDLFSVILKCHDPDGELYFISMARDRVTLSSYSDDAIRTRVEKWADGVPELA